MIVKGLSSEQISNAVTAISKAYENNVIFKNGPTSLNRNGDRVTFALRTVFSKGSGSRRSWTGRRMPVACWHVFRDVCLEIFKINSNAVIRTSIAVYRGASDFFDKYPETGYNNIGSMIQPVYFKDACDCV